MSSAQTSHSCVHQRETSTDQRDAPVYYFELSITSLVQLPGTRPVPPPARRATL